MTKPENEARAQRILDAAADLFVHYGYDKTTVSDIARQAGVSKGAIYLHFESKEQLFEALLVRELQAYAEEWLALIDADPVGGTVAAMYKNSLYALSRNAFMAAMFTQDRHVFGSYLRKPDNFFRRMQAEQAESPRYQFVKMMQDAGAMRRDLNPKVIAHIMNILAYGLVGMDGITPEKDIPPLDELIEGIAEFMERALAPAEGGSSEAGKAILHEIFANSRRDMGKMEPFNKSENDD